MTASASGAPTSSVYLYEPFGQPSASQTFGTNSGPSNATNAPMGWAASPTRKAETQFSLGIIQMGARVYLPGIGRFAQVDPISGGNVNGYSYVVDPINTDDYSGLFCLQCASGASFVQNAAPAQRVQNTAPIARFQPSAGVNRYQPTRGASTNVTQASRPTAAPAPVRVRGGVAVLPVVTPTVKTTYR